MKRHTLCTSVEWKPESVSRGAYPTHCLGDRQKIKLWFDLTYFISSLLSLNARCLPNRTPTHTHTHIHAYRTNLPQWRCEPTSHRKHVSRGNARAHEWRRFQVKRNNCEVLIGSRCHSTVCKINGQKATQYEVMWNNLQMADITNSQWPQLSRRISCHAQLIDETN